MFLGNALIRAVSKLVVILPFLIYFAFFYYSLLKVSKDKKTNKRRQKCPYIHFSFSLYTHILLRAFVSSSVLSLV